MYLANLISNKEVVRINAAGEGRNADLLLEEPAGEPLMGEWVLLPDKDDPTERLRPEEGAPYCVDLMPNFIGIAGKAD